MQGRLENQLKTEKTIENLLKDMPQEVYEYYLMFSATKEFRSCYEYILKLRKFLVWYADSKVIPLSSVDCLSITISDIAKYMKFIETRETKDGIVYTSFSLRKGTWSVLNSFFGYFEKKEKIDKNPMRLIDYPAKKDKVEHKFLEKDDLDKMIQAVNDGIWDNNSRMGKAQKKWQKRDLAILYTLIFTGMRSSALCELDINNIDFENNLITVIDKGHKTNTYNIPHKLKEVLGDWIEQRKILLGDNDADALFISDERNRISRSALYSVIRKYSQKALGYSVSPHRLRAAYGNIIYEKTHDIKFTSKAMKHENISTTMIYMNSDESKINKEVEDILSGVF